MPATQSIPQPQKPSQFRPLTATAQQVTQRRGIMFIFGLDPRFRQGAHGAELECNGVVFNVRRRPHALNWTVEVEDKPMCEFKLGTPVKEMADKLEEIADERLKHNLTGIGE